MSGSAVLISGVADSINDSVKTIGAGSVDAAGQVEGAGDAMVAAWKASGRELLVAADAVTELETATSDAADSADDAGTKTSKWIKTIVDGVTTYEQAAGGISKANKNISTSVDEAARKTDEFVLKLEEIVSKERIAVIEASVELNIAALEADAKIAVSIIEGLSESIQSTASLIGDLFGIFSDADRPDQLAILRQIDIENKRREAELKIQEELVRAQIRNLEAKTDALRNGDGLITIQADGLEVELEQFMMAVLRRIQIKASDDQALYLLGLPVAP